MPSHYLNQCRNIINWTLRNKLQWNFSRNYNFVIHENVFESVVCEMAAMLSRPQCVKCLRRILKSRDHLNPHQIVSGSMCGSVTREAYGHVMNFTAHDNVVIPDDDVIKWKHFPRYWPFVRGIHRSPVNSPHKDQWRGSLMFSLICVWINVWVNNREAGDLRRYRAHYDVTVMRYKNKLHDYNFPSSEQHTVLTKGLTVEYFICTITCFVSV